MVGEVALIVEVGIGELEVLWAVKRGESAGETAESTVPLTPGR